MEERGGADGSLGCTISLGAVSVGALGEERRPAWEGGLGLGSLLCQGLHLSPPHALRPLFVKEM